MHLRTLYTTQTHIFSPSTLTNVICSFISFIYISLSNLPNMFELIFYRKEPTTPSNRNSAAGDSNLESKVSHQCGGAITIPKKLPSQASLSSTNKKLTKLLINVNIQKSFGPVHVIISIENTVGDLIKAAIEVYLKEKRRPLLKDTDARCFDLHYSQFCFESLKPKEKLINLESRNFFLCPKPNKINSNNNTSVADSIPSCSDEAKTTLADIHAEDLLFPWTRLMDFLL